MVKAVHGRTMICRVFAVKVLAQTVKNTGKNSLAHPVNRCLKYRLNGINGLALPTAYKINRISVFCGDFTGGLPGHI
jgi:hypothetical protein